MKALQGHFTVRVMNASLLNYITVLQLKHKTAKPLLYTVYRTRNRKQEGSDREKR